MTLAHDDHVLTIREECELFLEALRGVPLATPVPSCPGWSAADLLAHVAEVQGFWAAVVRGADGETLPDPPRPPDEELARRAAAAGTELLAALAEHHPADTCWSWHDDGGSVGWVARRQAHEILVHRVDAELTAGRPVTPPPVETAADGVDEVLRVMVDGVPAWGELTLDGTTVRLECTNADAAWTLALGRFTGTEPASGTAYDLDAAAVLDEDDSPEASDLTVRGPAWALDRWAWGRGGSEELAVSGDRPVAERLRRLIAEATQ